MLTPKISYSEMCQAHNKILPLCSCLLLKWVKHLYINSIHSAKKLGNLIFYYLQIFEVNEASFTSLSLPLSLWGISLCKTDAPWKTVIRVPLRTSVSCYMTQQRIINPQFQFCIEKGEKQSLVDYTILVGSDHFDMTLGRLSIYQASYFSNS